MVKGISAFKDNSSLKFFSFFAKLLATNCLHKSDVIIRFIRIFLRMCRGREKQGRCQGKQGGNFPSKFSLCAPKQFQLNVIFNKILCILCLNPLFCPPKNIFCYPNNFVLATCLERSKPAESLPVLR